MLTAHPVTSLMQSLPPQLVALHLSFEFLFIHFVKLLRLLFLPLTFELLVETTQLVFDWRYFVAAA